MPRILVVDDEPLVALMVQRTLQGAHEVNVAHSAHACVDRFARSEDWDVIIVDLNLPDGDAAWVRDQLARIDPQLPERMVVVTGGAGTLRGKAFLDEPGVRWLQKPFRTAELMAMVDKVLATQA